MFFIKKKFSTGQLNLDSNSLQNSQSSQSSPYSQQNYYQYLTPPSQHSGDISPQHLIQSLDNYPTPSPESPGNWSSASPHSNSDWSEYIQSPSTSNANCINGNLTHPHNKNTDAIYI